MRESMKKETSSGKVPGAEFQQGKSGTDRGAGPIHTPLEKGHVYGGMDALNAGKNKKGK